MRLDHAEDLARFVEELKNETDRGLPLVSAALIDEKLLEMLQAFLVEGKSAKNLLLEGNAALGTFSSRIEACHSLGLIDQFEYQEISLIRKVRNEFAHARHGISFQTERVKGYCTSLQSDIPELDGYSKKDPRFIFMSATVFIVLRLLNRSAWIEGERRKAKSWPEGYPESVLIKMENS